MMKINIAELLKDCPKGMELDCTMFDNAQFVDIKEGDKPICIRTRDIYRYLTKFGTWTFDEDAKCVIFPKGRTTWEGFHRPFKDGDILMSQLGSIFILKEPNENNSYYGCYIAFDFVSKVIENCTQLCSKKDCRFATESEKQKLFNVIKANGYEWNDKTKTLERLFSYTIGTKVWIKSDKEHKYTHTIVGISRNSFGNLEYEVKEEKTGTVVHYPECLLIPITTKEPKFKVGDRIYNKNNKDYIYDIYEITDKGYRAKEINANSTFLILFGSVEDDYELVPRKFNIITFKPFDKVLVRDNEDCVWKIDFYSHYEDREQYPYVCAGNDYNQCIPYNEKTAHLIKTTNDCPDKYKTWKDEK